MTDVILAEKRKEAQERGIGFICDFHYPEKTGINAFDVSIILNNALDNAMEAAEGCERPFIDIKSWRQRNVYMIEVRNPFYRESYYRQRERPAGECKGRERAWVRIEKHAEGCQKISRRY